MGFHFKLKNTLLPSNKAFSVLLRQHKTLWYQFCNLKHFLRVFYNLASSCDHFSITSHVTWSDHIKTYYMYPLLRWPSCIWSIDHIHCTYNECVQNFMTKIMQMIQFIGSPALYMTSSLVGIPSSWELQLAAVSLHANVAPPPKKKLLACSMIIRFCTYGPSTTLYFSRNSMELFHFYDNFYHHLKFQLIFQ